MSHLATSCFITRPLATRFLGSSRLETYYFGYKKPATSCLVTRRLEMCMLNTPSIHRQIPHLHKQRIRALDIRYPDTCYPWYQQSTSPHIDHHQLTTNAMRIVSHFIACHRITPLHNICKRIRLLDYRHMRVRRSSLYKSSLVWYHGHSRMIVVESSS